MWKHHKSLSRTVQANHCQIVTAFLNCKHAFGNLEIKKLNPNHKTPWYFHPAPPASGLNHGIGKSSHVILQGSVPGCNSLCRLDIEQLSHGLRRHVLVLVFSSLSNWLVLGPLQASKGLGIPMVKKGGGVSMLLDLTLTLFATKLVWD